MSTQGQVFSQYIFAHPTLPCAFSEEAVRPDEGCNQDLGKRRDY